MAAVANNPGFAKKAGVPQSVGKEFIRADKNAARKSGTAKGVAKKSKGGRFA